MTTYTYGSRSLVDFSTKGWRAFLWPVVVFAAAGGLLLVAVGEPDLALLAAIVAACASFLLVALITGYRLRRLLQRLDVPTSLRLEGTQLSLYHGESVHVEIDLSDIVAVGDVGSNLSPAMGRLVRSGTIVTIRQPVIDGIDHFYILPDLQGYATLVGTLRSVLTSQPEECAGRWALSTRGKIELAKRLLILIGLIGLPVFIASDMPAGPDTREALSQLVFLWVMTAFAVVASAVIAWKVAHIPTSVQFQPWGIELKILFIWSFRIDRSNLRAVESIPASWGQPEQHRVKFRRGYFDISPTFFSRYADLVSCCQKFLGTAE